MTDFTPLSTAFKEWAVICQALAEGKQAVILRKGGIADEGGLFHPEHLRFWLMPTFFHQQQTGIKAEAVPLLDAGLAEVPPSGTVRLRYFAAAAGVYHVQELYAALLLDHLHMWNEETIRARFAYRKPGIFVLPVRVFAVPQPHSIPADPLYDGCKSWVPLTQALPTDGAVPVLSDRDFADVQESISARLHAFGWA